MTGTSPLLSNACGKRIDQFGTALEKELPERLNTYTTMMTANEFQMKLKRRAKRFLFQGDVKRYLNTLQEIYLLRTAHRGTVA